MLFVGFGVLFYIVAGKIVIFNTGTTTIVAAVFGMISFIGFIMLASKMRNYAQKHWK